MFNQLNSRAKIGSTIAAAILCVLLTGHSFPTYADQDCLRIGVELPEDSTVALAYLKKIVLYVDHTGEEVWKRVEGASLHKRRVDCEVAEGFVRVATDEGPRWVNKRHLRIQPGDGPRLQSGCGKVDSVRVGASRGAGMSCEGPSGEPARKPQVLDVGSRVREPIKPPESLVK